MQYAFIISFGNARMQIVLKWTIYGYDGTDFVYFQLTAFLHTLVAAVVIRLVLCSTEGCRSRYRVAQIVWPYMLSIAVTYFVTLCLFPGIESEVISCRLHSWMPVVLIAVFNLFDFIGKVFLTRVIC